MYLSKFERQAAELQEKPVIIIGRAFDPVLVPAAKSNIDIYYK